MKLQLILLFQIIGIGQLFADSKVLKLKKEDIEKVSQYFILSDEKGAKNLPLILTKDQVGRYSFISGIHRILPGEKESMLDIRCDLIENGKKVSRILYKFTVTPKINLIDIHKNKSNWNLILANRKITQYLIEETKTDGKFTYKNTILKVRK